MRTMPSVATSRLFLTSNVRDTTPPRSRRSMSAGARLKPVIRNVLAGSDVAPPGVASSPMSVSVAENRITIVGRSGNHHHRDAPAGDTGHAARLPQRRHGRRPRTADGQTGPATVPTAPSAARGRCRWRCRYWRTSGDTAWRRARTPAARARLFRKHERCQTSGNA